ncbi:hypothetical protein MGAST_19135 [Mycobacterium gastri 'Wayne']|uniref:Uncharacterized protein n=1 Tax=Mycobacterium gastri TaxID=1777 RepID=A0A1X1VHK0_MYCGS|nr:hypothetical protein MGAST_19135 [Mycobacterium gastri 'Wayne']ORV68521.1 hypothetical protein AWC07_07650 [Mycobacterium gastri]
MFTIPGLWWLPSGGDDDAVKWLRRYSNLDKGEPIMSASGCPTPVRGHLPPTIGGGRFNLPLP